MKANNVLFTLFIASSLLLTNCSKKDAAPPATKPTALQLTFTDDLGNKVTGATIQLYTSETDWRNGTNIVASGLSDANGIITFSNLSAIKYYWFAQKDCKNNVSGSATTLAPITANQTTTVGTVLNSTGSLIFHNTSSNPYHVYVNGQFVQDMNGGTSSRVDWLPLGGYSIHVVQVSGYAISPTDETFSGNLSVCGGTLTTTFP